jgi:hypothetical protein
MIAADRAGSLPAYRESIEGHMETVEDQNTVGEKVSDAGEIFDDFGSFDAA